MNDSRNDSQPLQADSQGDPGNESQQPQADFQGDPGNESQQPQADSQGDPGNESQQPQADSQGVPGYESQPPHKASGKEGIDSSKYANESITPTARWLYMTIAYLSLGLGLIGAFLPIMPTVPFLIVATWAATKGSPKLHHWLYNHKTFGPRLKAWDEHRAIETKAKWTACIFMTGSWFIMLYMTTGWILPTIAASVFISIGIYIITRPSPPA